MRITLTSLAAIAFATAAAPAMAQDTSQTEPAPAVTFTGSVTGITDYRFRGITQTDEKPALQGSLNVNHESGLYAGVWASSLDSNVSLPGFGSAEVDLYAGYTKTYDSGVGVDVGLLYYLYPDKRTGLNTDFFEPYGSLMYSIGPVSTKVGFNYAVDGQSALGGSESVYLRADATVSIPGTPVSALAHVGRTDGILGALSVVDDTYYDWSLGLEASYKFAKVGVQYVDTDIKDFGIGYNHRIGADATVLGYLTFSF